MSGVRPLRSWGVRLALLLALVAGGGQASAQLPPGPLTLAEAVRLALSRDVRGEATSLQLARQALLGAAEQQQTWENPELRLTRDVGQSGEERTLPRVASDGGVLDSFNVRLRWPLPAFGQTSALAEAARLKGDAAGASAARARQVLAHAVARLFVAALAAEAGLRLFDEELVRARRLAEQTSGRVQGGAATGLERQLNELEGWEVAARRGELLGERQSLRTSLAGLLGQPLSGPFPELDPTPLQAACELPAAGTTTGVPAPAQSAARPDVIAQQRLTEAARAELTATDRSWLPWPDYVQLAYQFGDEGPPDTLSLGVSLPLPLLDRRGGEARERRAALEQSRVAHRAAAALAAEELAEAMARLRASQEELAVLELAEPTLQTSRQEAERAVAGGQEDLRTLTEVEQRGARLRRARVQAQLRCQEALLDVRLAAGWEL